MKKQLLILTALASCMSSWTQNIKETDSGVKFQTASPILNGEIIFYSPSIVRVIKYPSAQMPDKKSYPIIKTPEKINIVYKRNGDKIQMKTENMLVTLHSSTGKVTYQTLQGNTLLSEKELGTNFTPRKDVTRDAFTVSQAFALQPEEAIYGLGQRQSGAMNHRNQQVHLSNGNTNICIPYFTSEKGYGVYWDNPGISQFSDTPYETSFSSQVGECADYYFMYEDGTQDGVIACIRNLTGNAPMFPLWTMGYWQCRERYKSPDELCEVLDKYRELKVPLDGIVQDWQYWGCDSNWNAMKFMNPRYINKLDDKEALRYLPNGEDKTAKFDKPRFKTPEEMIKYVHKNNAHLMISVWASFGPWTDQFKELDKMGALLKFETWPPKSGAHPYDPFNKDARDLYWRYLSHLHNMGIDAWWTDSTEPDHLNPKDSDFDLMTADGSFRSVHNAFPLATNQGVYNNQRAVSNDKRVFQMTRSGYFGQQHYGALSWSGDVVSSWEVLRNQIPAGLNFTLCGIPYWNTDLGGFFGWEYNNDCTNVAYQELHARWFQWGCFMPLMRNHCSSPMMNEIWRFGKEGDWAYDAQKRFIDLRYRLLPYIYSLTGAVTHENGTIMRPLVMDFATDRKAILLDNEYMFGKNILVCPVTQPLYTKKVEGNKGVATVANIAKASSPVQVYLPKGSKWIDFWTNEMIEGGREISRECPISIMPLYIKAGSILPLGPKVQYTSEKKWNDLDICIYPGANGEFTLYEDEFDNYDYEKGAFTSIRFTWDDANRTLTISDRNGSYPGMLKNRRFNLTVMKPGKQNAETVMIKADKKVSYSGKKMSFKL
ncbi:MAG: DUF5110 domain-containing protein [Bacteroides sp.]|nr:DUF5110 domain-containing protein [Bacteroides sp.]